MLLEKFNRYADYGDCNRYQPSERYFPQPPTWLCAPAHPNDLPHTACGTTRQVIFWTNNGNQEAKRIAMKNPRLSFINNIVIFSAAI